jgi:LacI family transcriptional regulator
MRNGKTKISDIANALGISAISVSRALSGQYGVSSDLRDRVLEKAREMGYVKPKSSDDLNILLLHQRAYLDDNKNYTQVIHGIENAIQKTNAEYHTEFIEKDKHENLQLPYKLSRGIHFDGVILFGHFKHEYIEIINEKIKNLVIYSSYCQSLNYNSVFYNYSNGTYKLCEYLIKRGHSRIGFLSDSSNKYKNREKALGMAMALEDHGLPVVDEFFIYEDENFEDKVTKLVSREDRPTALICQRDYTAVKLLKLLHTKEILVPDDISIVGGGNSEIASMSIPALTTLDLNIQYACETAVVLLLKSINNPDKPIENIMINSMLIERDSVKNLLQDTGR